MTNHRLDCSFSGQRHKWNLVWYNRDGLGDFVPAYYRCDLCGKKRELTKLDYIRELADRNDW